MGRKVLVLNSDYSALSICTVPKAFLLVYLEKADLVAESSTAQLHTINATYPMPSVIRLHKYVHVPYKGVMLSRQNVFRRDSNKCVYCGSHEDLTLDHLIPKSKGGKTNWDNLVTACRRCNSRKGDNTPEEAGLKLPRKPFKPSFIMFLRDFSGSIEENWIPYLGMKDR
ncbi:MAG: HNH endonuclease [Spirosomaceae bacterium]|nr:HNH endonuclease [Spirosomataceae bacterium]